MRLRKLPPPRFEDVDPGFVILGIVVLAARPPPGPWPWPPCIMDTETARFEERRAKIERWAWACGEDVVMVFTEDVSEGLRDLFCCSCWERCLNAYEATGSGTGQDINGFLAVVVVVITLSRASTAAIRSDARPPESTCAWEE
jgi:hypothetical protein